MPTFQSVVLLARKTATGVEVPPEVMDELGAGRHPAVVVSVNGYEYRTTVGNMGGTFLFPLSSEHRAASGLEAGDEVDVTITVDEAPRTVEVPSDLQELLDADPAANAAYEALSHSRKRALVDPIGQAKAPETRRRRIEKALEALRG